MSSHPLATVSATLEAWPGYAPIRRALEELPHLRVYVGGGALRRAILDEDRAIKDFDLFVGPDSFEELVVRLGDAGRIVTSPYGSPRWLPWPERTHSADLIPIRRYRNGLWPCEDILDVLNQADFTLNALAVDLRTGDWYDPQNGARDARRRTLRAVRLDPPARPIRPDVVLTYRAVLWHRLVHYANVLRLEIDPITLDWLHCNRPAELESRQFARLFFAPKLDLPTGQPGVMESGEVSYK